MELLQDFTTVPFPAQPRGFTVLISQAVALAFPDQRTPHLLHHPLQSKPIESYTKRYLHENAKSVPEVGVNLSIASLTRHGFYRESGCDLGSILQVDTQTEPAGSIADCSREQKPRRPHKVERVG